MKKLFMCFLLMISAQAVQAIEIAFEIPCRHGGVRSISGDYAPETGEFNIQTEVVDCASRRHRIVNGSVTATGTYALSEDQTEAEIDAEIVSDLTHANAERELSVTYNCSKTVSGLYTITEETLDGTSSNNCSRSGSVRSPVLRMIAGFEEDEEGVPIRDESGE